VKRFCLDLSKSKRYTCDLHKRRAVCCHLKTARQVLGTPSTWDLFHDPGIPSCVMRSQFGAAQQSITKDIGPLLLRNCAKETSWGGLPTEHNSKSTSTTPGHKTTVSVPRHEKRVCRVWSIPTGLPRFVAYPKQLLEGQKVDEPRSLLRASPYCLLPVLALGFLSPPTADVFSWASRF